MELINSAIASADHYQEVGGYFNFIYLNGRGKNYGEKMLEVFDHRAHLATEIVRAFHAHMIKKDVAYQLIDRLIFKNHKFDAIEEALFRESSDAVNLERILRGYKLPFR